MHITPAEAHANELVDAIVATRVRAFTKPAPFAIAPDVAQALAATSSASREYNLGRLIWAHTWNANANAFGAVPQAKQVAIVRDFEARREHFMGVARKAYEAALARIERDKELTHAAMQLHRAAATKAAADHRAAAKKAARDYAAMCREARA